MRFIKYLQEKYEFVVKDTKNRVEVFEWPDRKELQEMPEVRFLINLKTEKFYAWDGNSPFIHFHIINKGGSRMTPTDHLLFGLGFVHNGRITYSDEAGGYINGNFIKTAEDLRKRFKELFLSKVVRRYFTVDRETFLKSIKISGRRQE